MKRFALVIGIVVLAGACEKPSEENCRKALANVRTLLGTHAEAGDIEGDVRRCKGGSSKKNVECAMNAATVDQLRDCGFLKIPDKKPGDDGSAPAPAPGPAAAPDPAAPAPGSAAAQ